MIMNDYQSGRRHFLRTATTFAGAMTGLSILPASLLAGTNATTTNAAAANANRPNSVGPDTTGKAMSAPADDLNLIGPREGYTPQIGTLISMMAWLRVPVINSIKNLSVEQLDWLIDAKANTIGALAFHLAATDVLYHAHSFDGVKEEDMDKALGEKFIPAMDLGDKGREKIKGNNAKFYIDVLMETREKTLAEFKKRDDKWLMIQDPKWFTGGPTNNYCKWFHVCEHESHHLGQIKLLASRVPGAKSPNNNG
jgi:uncharacterized damage-inducible protein DinB